MKQFNLQEYLKNPNLKVVTRDGRSARIICTNRLDENYPVIVLVNNEDSEKCYSYSEFGKFENRDCELDLLFAPEKKSAWINLYKMNSITVLAHESIIQKKKQNQQQEISLIIFQQLK